MSRGTAATRTRGTTRTELLYRRHSRARTTGGTKPFGDVLQHSNPEHFQWTLGTRRLASKRSALEFDEGLRSSYPTLYQVTFVKAKEGLQDGHRDLPRPDPKIRLPGDTTSLLV